MHPHCAWEELPSLRCGSYVCMTWCFRRSHDSAYRMLLAKGTSAQPRGKGGYSLVARRVPCQELQSSTDLREERKLSTQECELAEPMLYAPIATILPFAVTVSCWQIPQRWQLRACRAHVP